MNLDNTVYKLVAMVPEGKVTTYGELARAAGKPKASRLIGQILNRNPNPIVVPCHRVVKSNGDVGGYAYGSSAKSKLLTKEGVTISKGKIVDFGNTRYRFTSSNLLR
jgi:methylated-DNA-[protein]-cysteine S-methyltransferase